VSSVDLFGSVEKLDGLERHHIRFGDCSVRPVCAHELLRP
jgi:hypothetical protein